MVDKQATCPICGNSSFGPYGLHENVVCTKCGSRARTRLMFLALQQLDLLKPGKRILHFAPEPGLTEAIFERVGDGYVVGDFNPKKLKHSPAKQKYEVDLCQPPEHLLQGKFDLVIHSHVLEHIRCNWALAFLVLHRALQPGAGIHMFSIPITGTRASEDLTKLSKPDRLERFRQGDHMRRFGHKDFPAELEKLASLTFSRALNMRDVIGREAATRQGASGHVFALVPEPR